MRFERLCLLNYTKVHPLYFDVQYMKVYLFSYIALYYKIFSNYDITFDSILNPILRFVDYSVLIIIDTQVA